MRKAWLLAGWLAICLGAQAQGVTQVNDRAALLRGYLKQVKLPPGFKIALYALVPDARQMAVDPASDTVFVGTGYTRVWMLGDSARQRIADSVKPFTPTQQFRVPSGVCLGSDGALYVVELNRVRRFPAAKSGSDAGAQEIVPEGQLMPAEEESIDHGAHNCRVGADGKLYVALGNPYNVPPPDKLASYDKSGMMGIIRMDKDGKNREVFARGVRNAAGMDFNPKDNTLWFTDTRAASGSTYIAPGELNRAPKAGLHFGFPWYGGGHERSAEYKDELIPDGVTFPLLETEAHADDRGIAFYRGKMFPEKYRGGLFIAQHGSANRTLPIGARVMFVPMGKEKDGKPGGPEVFASGWVTADNEFHGRPTDVAELSDGSLLVSDDFMGAIYRISYSAPEPVDKSTPVQPATPANTPAPAAGRPLT